MAYDMFGTREMTEAVEQLKPVGNFFKSTFFRGPVEEHYTESIDIDIYKGKRKVAPYTRATNKSTPLSRANFSTGSFKVPYIKISRSLEAAQTLLRMPGENIYNRRSPADRAQEQIVKDLSEMNEAIERAEELQAAQAIINAKVIIKGQDVDAEIDLQRDAALTFTAATLWNAGGVDIHAQLRAIARLIFQKSGFTPDTIIMAPDVLDVFFADAGVRALLDNRRIEAGGLASAPSTQTYPGARYYGQFAGFSIWEYHELYLDDADNTEKTLVPAKKIVVCSQNMRCKAHYGPIKDFGALVPMARFAKSVEEQDPSVKTAILQSAPAFMNHDPDATALVTVLP